MGVKRLSRLKNLVGRVGNGVPVAIKNRILQAHFDYNGDYRKSVFLAGAGRSGTTWVSTILNYDNHYRDLFEPFNAHIVRQCHRFFSSLYLRPDNKDRVFLKPARRILKGAITHWWVDQSNRRFLVYERLIKEIRANLWLKWLKVNFPELRTILLMRHPCAVVESRLMLEWPSRLQQYLAQTELIEDHLGPFRDDMIAAKTPFERHLYVWCIHHYVPLRQFGSGEIHVAFYENFLVKPEEEIGRLFRFVDRKAKSEVFEMLPRPSRTSRKDSEARSGHPNLVDSWRKRIDPNDLKRALQILGQFGLDKIYNEESLPNVNWANETLL